MALDLASAARADIVYPRLNVTVDTGTGIDVRNLDAVNGATNNVTTTATATNANDNVERTFDPATGAVVNTNHAGTTLFRTGWGFPVVDMEIPAGAQDTACNAIITAQTLNVLVNMSMNWSSTLADPTSGITTLTWRASLWRYNPSTDAGTLIAAGTATTPNWDVTPVTGDAKGSLKQATIPITVGAGGIEFSAGEVLFLQIGFNTGTLPNPLSGATTYTFALQVDSNSTLIDFAANQGIRQKCAIADTTQGRGTIPLAKLAPALTRSLVGWGTVTSTRAALISKTFSLIGKGTVTHTKAVGRFFSLIGKGTPTFSRVVTAAKSFTLDGRGTVTRSFNNSLARSATGKGTVTFTKASIISKTFSLVGNGIVTLSKTTQASRTFNLIGTGAVTKSLSNAISRTATGKGEVTFAKASIVSKIFSLIGQGTITKSLALDLSRTIIGKGLVTEIHPVQAFRTFFLIGKGHILTTGPNASTVTIPIDEVPVCEGGGGGTTIIKKTIINVFDD